MTVDINDLTIATPVAVSPSNPVALELSGAEAIARFPSVVKVLSDGSIQLSAPTKALRAKVPTGPAANGQKQKTGHWEAPRTTGIARP